MWGRPRARSIAPSMKRGATTAVARQAAAWEKMTYATSTYWRYRRQRALPYGGHERRRRDCSTDALWRSERRDHGGQGGRRLHGLLAAPWARASHQPDGDTRARQYLGAQKPGGRMGDFGQRSGQPARAYCPA